MILISTWSADLPRQNNPSSSKKTVETTKHALPPEPSIGSRPRPIPQGLADERAAAAKQPRKKPREESLSFGEEEVLTPDQDRDTLIRQLQQAHHHYWAIRWQKDHKPEKRNLRRCITDERRGNKNVVGEKRKERVPLRVAVRKIGHRRGRSKAKEGERRRGRWEREKRNDCLSFSFKTLRLSKLMINVVYIRSKTKATDTIMVEIFIMGLEVMLQVFF